jgi:Ca2+-binding EF-hand superfamily protein
MSLRAAILTLYAVLAGDAPRDVRSAQPAGIPAAAEVRDCVLVLDSGPLHLRLHITLEGTGLSGARAAYVDRLIDSLDTDGDGRLSRAEADRSPLLTSTRRTVSSSFVQSLQANRSVGRREIEQAVERVGGETVVYRQDESSAGNDREVFKFLDADGNGLIDRAEMAAVAGKIMERDQDRDDCVSFQEFLPPPEPAPNLQVVPLQPAIPDRPTATIADLLRDAAEPLLPRRLIKRYDRNRDGQLSQAELRWSVERIAAIDANRDSYLNERELARIGQSEVDLELAVELAAPEGQPSMTLRHAAGQRADSAVRPDYARVVLDGAVLTVSYRSVDPIAAAMANAMQVFNQLDVDANGYLDEQETSQRTRFARGLFDAIDADGDGKIFGEEMERYVTVRGEPAAASCRVNLYDTGHGFFQSLDANGDGRISQRERRGMQKTLENMDRDRRPGLTAREPVRHFHLELVRGSFQLFGPADQMVSQTPSFDERAPVGPIWFQRMDRNNDGDLTWNEFFGDKEWFHRLDADRDGLIDPQEAAKADELATAE